MSRFRSPLPRLAASLCFLGLSLAAGCGESQPAGTKPVTVPQETLKASLATIKLNPDEIAEIKKLPADQQAAALEQKICPISDEHLGSMGVPIRVEADGKTAFLCCDGCVGAFKKDPAAAFTKLGK
jgi:YHS domain-containing protein